MDSMLLFYLALFKIRIK